MARSYLTKAVSKKATPQSAPIPDSTQVANSAGGFAWAVDNWKRLERFLVLGSEGGTYYISEHKLTKENIKTIEECVKEDGLRTVKTITEISDGGRAPKNDPALFALAVCISKGDSKTKQAAAAALPKVARIGTHLFHFAEFANEMRGWGAVLRNAVADWYLAKDANKLAYQLVKYQSRDGWSHRDLLRLSHPNPAPISGQAAKLKAAFNWAVGKEDFKNQAELPSLIASFEEAKTADEARTIKLITEANLPRECVKTEYLKSVKVWEALLEKMPLTAMIRNLGNMTALGLLAPNSAGTMKVIGALNNIEALKKARVHPLHVMLADSTYRQGRGLKGSNTWTPVQAIRDALENAFYTTFDLVEPTNKRWFLGLDVSGSMGSGLSGYPMFTCREASALMAMVTMRTEKVYFVGGFTNDTKAGGQYRSTYGLGNGFTPLSISAKMKLETVVNTINGLDFGGTDCALPMIYATKHKIPADVFVIYTDSETWAGDIHPSQALQEYRQKMGIPAKLVVVGMASNGFTIADPNDTGMLDVVGFDTTVPSVMADFATDGQTKAAEDEE